MDISNERRYTNESKIDPSTPVRYLTGVGEKRAAMLASLDITTVGDLLYHFPRAYQHRGDITPIAAADLNEPRAYLLTVSAAPTSARLKGRMTITKLAAFDESGKCDITFFNQNFLREVFTVGSTFRFWGRMQVFRGRYNLTSPQYEPYYEGLKLPEYTPVYPLTAGITQKFLKKTISTALDRLSSADELDIIPEEIRRRYMLCDLKWALDVIHAPEDPEQLERARRRFVFEELYTFALGVSLSKLSARKANAPIFDHTDTSDLEAILPFPLTGAQKRVIADIAGDVSSPSGTPMSRLVAGDVGCGKTVCAAAAVFMALRSGHQAALMAPTEILARQHHEELKPLFEALGYSCELLCGSTPAAQKRRIRDGLESGALRFVIGTHALLTDNVKFADAGLFVTDEQHRFGVKQRAGLAQKGKDAHILVMSATPIPRTLALILYGDLSVSQIDEMPPGRQKVSTFLVDESYRSRLNGFIEKQALEGRQVYIVCPAIENDDDDGQSPAFPDMKNAVDHEKELRAAISPSITTALMHGKLPAAEKERIMARFASGEIQVLVSTTVIEVGVNVPNATLMVVENAERFGLSQLHQLRGRVGRGKYKSWCILVSEAKGDTAAARLETMTKTNDGYEIARRDLELRGPGDFVPSRHGSARQHGTADAFAFSQYTDMETVKQCFEAAAVTVGDDPTLSGIRHEPLRRALDKLYELEAGAMN